MLQDITRTIPAGGSSIFDIQAAGLTCVAATLPDFLIRFDNDGEATYRVGYEYAPPDGFRKWQVRNPRTAPLTVTFTFWDGKFVDRQQISSAPQSFQPVTLEDIQDTGFLGGTSAIGTAASPPEIFIYNPAASGITSVIRSLEVQMTTAGYVQVAVFPIANTPAVIYGATKTIANFQSKFGGAGAAGLTEMYYRNGGPALPAVAGGGFRYKIPVDAVGLKGRMPLVDPLILPETSVAYLTGSNIGAAELLLADAEILELPAG